METSGVEGARITSNSLNDADIVSLRKAGE